MAEHARLRRRARSTIAAHSSRSASRSAARQRDAAVASRKCLREEVELPGQLLDVERDAVRQVRVATRSSRAAALQQLDERHRLPVERRVLGRRRRAEVRLQRDVAEILQREDAELVGVAEDRRHRQRHLLQQPATLTNGSVAKSIGPACSASTIDGPSAGRIRK